jgi:polyketide cyclase/dehydrase/lipid transport protein
VSSGRRSARSANGTRRSRPTEPGGGHARGYAAGVKSLDGTAQGAVAQDIEACFATLVAFADYPSWYPEVVQAVEVLESDAAGVAVRARTKLHVARGPLVQDFDLVMAIDAQRPEIVKLARIPGDAERFEVTWRLRRQEGTRISLELHAELPVPRFIPLGDIGDSIAEGFMSAALARLQG